jgi:hypothetical protein
VLHHEDVWGSGCIAPHSLGIALFTSKSQSARGYICSSEVGVGRLMFKWTAVKQWTCLFTTTLLSICTSAVQYYCCLLNITEVQKQKNVQRITSKGKAVLMFSCTQCYDNVLADRGRSTVMFFILAVDESGWSAVSFMPQLVHPREKPLSPWYPLDRRLGRPHSQFVHCRGGKRISCSCQDLNYYSAATQPILHQDGNYKKRNEITDQCCEAERLTAAHIKK